MIRTKLIAIAFAVSAFAVAGAATLTGLSWTAAAGKPALRLIISGGRHGRLEVRRHGRLLRVDLRDTTLGAHVQDLPGRGAVKGVYPYLAHNGHGVNVDVLLTKRGGMHLMRASYGYEAVLTGVTGVTGLTGAAPSPVAAPMPAQSDASGPNVLEKLSYFAFPGNRIELHIVTSKHPTAPAAFVLTKPAMVVLDIPDTVIKPSLGELQVGAGDVRNVAAVEGNNMARVVIRLVSPAAYRAYVRPNAIDVIIASPNNHIAQAAIAEPKARVLPPGPNHLPRYTLRAISFHRGRNGAGKVEVRLSSSNVAVSVHNRGHRIVLTFHDTAVPPAEQRRLIVTDFATPIDTIRTFQDGRSVRMVLHAYGHYTQMGYQAQREFLMRVTPVSRRAYRILERKKNKYASRKISLNFQHIGVRAALEVLANFSGLNFVTSSAVHGTLTLELHDVPWKQALHLILRTKNLGMERKGNIILVAPAAQMAKERDARLKARAEARKLEPLETVLIRLNYAKASEIATLLKSTRTVGTQTSNMPFSSVSYSKQATESTSLLSKRGQVTVDKRTNSLIIQDTPQRVRAIRRLIAKLDRPVRQVLIEARLVEANDGFNKSLGAQLGLNYSYSTPSTSVSTCPAAQCAGSGLSANPGLPSTTAGTLPSSTLGAFNVNLPSVGVGSTLPATFALTVAKLASNNLLNLELSALQAENKGKIISSPRLITANDRKADIKQGQEQFFNLGFGQSMLQQAVLGLSVTPQITPDNRIIMTVKITDNSFANAVQGTLDEKSLKTQVLVNNGQTVVIGGIYQNSRLRTVTKVPFLGDIPFLGYLFRNTSVNNTRSELLIFLTPRILAPALSLQSG
ncbi:type IV pilus secretin family protein [Acidiferrobacter sp.]|uniref:type IV pilus secretin family protein n=1 Tax=Acidiferrobacter sp. TaxID=1872107 RepID=UPI00262879E7|nr:type IV pilus secretin family protein [Acidiferrobacter sp.]